MCLFLLYANNQRVCLVIEIGGLYVNFLQCEFFNKYNDLFVQIDNIEKPDS